MKLVIKKFVCLCCLVLCFAGKCVAEELPKFVEIKSSYFVPRNFVKEFAKVWDSFDYYYNLVEERELLKLLMPKDCPIPITRDDVWLEESLTFYVMYNDEKPNYFLRDFTIFTSYINQKLMYSYSRYVSIPNRTTTSCSMAIDGQLCTVSFDDAKRVQELRIMDAMTLLTRWLQWDSQGKLKYDETVPLFKKPKFKLEEQKKELEKAQEKYKQSQ
jgi:hypothetical protein